MLNDFENYLEEEEKSPNTIKSYCGHVRQYLKWYQESFGMKFNMLYRENILEFKSYLHNIKKQNGKTINAKLSALLKFNEFLVDTGNQEDIVVTKKDMMRIQVRGTSPTDVTKQEVERFRQQMLEHEGSRNYCIVTIMVYAGLRVSEVLNLKLDDVNTRTKEIVVKHGKGSKQRIVYMNNKISNALDEYLEKRPKAESDYLFISNRGNRLDRTVINKMFNRYSNKITPHKLRHFFCTNALENGFAVHEVAYLAGHSNIHTTLRYTNPSEEEMKAKMNRL